MTTTQVGQRRPTRLQLRLRFWASPPDQPPWARPVLLAIAALSAVAYAWRLGSSTEIFYAAADRSMSSSWHNFLFGSFDPSGTVSLDKLPGAFWFQALSVRVFGAHTWAVALPQVIEGVLCVLVLYRVVRRCAGPAAGLVAAALLATSPATMTLNRGNIADTLLVLLLVLAADATVAALETGRHGHLLLAGVWVGLAFQAKMLEAWLLLPALLLAFVIAGREPVLRRFMWCGAMVLVTVAVSLSWMTVVSLTPRDNRPYVDGTTNDSVFTQVFDYNGFGRVGEVSPNQVLGRTLGVGFLAAPPPHASATRLLRDTPGRDIGWLLPAAALTVLLLLWALRRRERTDLVRAGVLLWGAWLGVFVVVFSVSAINWYYLGALSPPIAALLGIAASQAWSRRHERAAPVTTAAIAAVTVGYALWLLPDSGTGRPVWLLWAAAALGIVAVGSTILFATTGHRLTALAMLVGVGSAMVLVPLVATVSVVINNLGAFDTPFQPTAVTHFNRAFFGAPLQPIATLPEINRVRNGAPDLLAAQTSVVAAPFIFATGEEALPIGGYNGSGPQPTLAQLRDAIAHGQLHLVLSAQHSDDARIHWIRSHCLDVHPTGPQPAIPLNVSYCVPANAG